MSIDKLPVFKDFPAEKGQTKIVKWLKNEIYAPIAKRINWLLDFFTATDDGEGGEFAPGFGPVSYIDFDITYEDGQKEGRLQWNFEDGVLEVGLPGGNVNMQIGNEMPFRVTNDEGAVIPNGRAVLVNGATGNRLTVRFPDLSSQTDTFAVIGLATEDLADPGTGFVNTVGFVRGSIDQPLDTSGFAEGGQVFLGDQGVFLTAPPTKPNRTVFIGIVKKVSATEGEVWVNIIHLPMLHELSDVLITGIEDTDKLVWNASNSRWENEPTPFGEIYAEDNVTETVISTIGTFAQVTIFDTNGESNNTTPDHTSDDITITKAGRYMINCSMAIGSAGGSANTLHIHVAKNNDTVEFANVHAHRRMSGGAGDKGSVSLSGIVDLQVDDTVELWITNDSSTQNYVVEDVTLTIVRITR